MKKSTAIHSFVVAVTLIFATAAPAQATVTNIKDCAFGPAQVFDVQYNFSGGNLNISGVDYPYGGSGQLNSSNWSDGDYVKFVDSVSAPGTLALERFNSSDVSQGLLDATGTFRAYGDDFIFYLGGGFYGTVI